jgi:hypothetical protein
VGAKGAEPDADECGDGADEHERAVHRVDCSGNGL